MSEIDLYDWEDDDEDDGPFVHVSEAANMVRETRYYKFGAKLECGHVFWGVTSAPEILSVVHHKFECEEHGPKGAVEFVSTKPLRDRWGRV
jgi:hypothetical protein